MIDHLIAISKLLFSKRQSRRLYSQFGEDAVLSEMFGRKKTSGVYVDVGCYHPRKHSNTYLLYKRGWSGLLVDIEPAKIIACRILRPRDKAVLAAVSDSSGMRTVYAPKRFSVLASLSQVGPDYKPIGQIRSATLTELLDEHLPGRQIDLLSIDVEGHDLEVLRGLDFRRFRPGVIVVESWDGQDVASIQSGPIHALLAAQGYGVAAWMGKSLIYAEANGGDRIAGSRPS